MSEVSPVKRKDLSSYLGVGEEVLGTVVTPQPPTLPPTTRPHGLPPTTYPTPTPPLVLPHFPLIPVKPSPTAPVNPPTRLLLPLPSPSPTLWSLPRTSRHRATPPPTAPSSPTLLPALPCVPPLPRHHPPPPPPPFHCLPPPPKLWEGEVDSAFSSASSDYSTIYL